MKFLTKKLLATIAAALLLATSAWEAPAVEHGYMAVFYVPGVYGELGKPFVWHTIYYGDSEAGVRAAIYEACAAEYGAEPRAVIISIEDWGPWQEEPITE